MEPDFQKALDRVSTKCNGATVMRLITKLMLRTTDWSHRQIERGLLAHCTITQSPEGPVIQGRYPRVPRCLN